VTAASVTQSRQFVRIARHEWRMLRADRACWLGTTILAMAVLYGTWTGVSWIRFQERTIGAARADEAATIAAKRGELREIQAGTREAPRWTDPRSPALMGGINHGGRIAWMPPGPLGMLSIGQGDLYPYYFTVSIKSREAFIGADEIENPQILLTGRFDLAFAIVWLFPLVILALSFNVLSLEKEQGTLPLVLSQQVSLRTLMAAKVSVRAALVVGIAVVIACIASALGGATVWQSETAWRLAIWIVAVTSYGLFWFALAVLVNAAGRSSSTNAVVLAGLWLIFVLLIPTIVNSATTAAYPIASRVEMIQAVRRASDAANARGSELLGRYFQDHPDMVRASAAALSAEDFYSRRIAVQDDTERQVQPVLDRFSEQLTRRERLANRFQYLSPAMVAHMLFNDIADSSSARYRHFVTQVEGYHRDWRAFFYPRILQRATLSERDWENMPAFVYHPEPNGAVLARALAGLGGLILPTLCVSALALMRLTRYPVACA
jgi:ABC-2 type transport system permease protein